MFCMLFIGLSVSGRLRMIECCCEILKLCIILGEFILGIVLLKDEEFGLICFDGLMIEYCMYGFVKVE